MNRPTEIVTGFGRRKPFSVVGDVYDILLRGAETGGRFAAIEMHASVGNGPPPHHHTREDETFYLLDGELTVTIDGRPHVAATGSLVFCPRGVPHTLRNTGSRPARALIIISPAGFERFLEEIGEPHANGDLQPKPVTDHQIARLQQAAPRYGLQLLPPPGPQNTSL